jgi:insertion element IS1 protein InsB
LLPENLPLAGISGVTGISEVWLQKYINEKYENIPGKIETVKEKGRLTVECDEMWSFAGLQKEQHWVWLAIDTI